MYYDLVDPTIDQPVPTVERGTDVRPITNPVEGLVPDLDALVCRSIGPMCLANTHDDDDVCRPDDACWTYDGPRTRKGEGVVLEHVSHGGPCWHEVEPDGGAIQIVIAEPGSGEAAPSADVDGPADDDEPGEGVLSPSPGSVVEPSSFDDLRDGLYAALIAEGNPPQLSITLATLYAEWKLADVPNTMAMLARVAESIGAVLGSDGEAPGGFVGKLLQRAMKGNG